MYYSPSFYLYKKKKRKKKIFPRERHATIETHRPALLDLAERQRHKSSRNRLQSAAGHCGLSALLAGDEVGRNSDCYRGPPECRPLQRQELPIAVAAAAAVAFGPAMSFNKIPPRWLNCPRRGQPVAGKLWRDGGPGAGL